MHNTSTNQSDLSTGAAEPANRGRFIVIDGTDGSGKTTQTALLKKTLETEGYEVVHFKFPQYGKKAAGPVEEYLAGTYGAINPYIASVLFSVDRFDAGFTLRKHLAEGKIIISERYVTSNAGHQGGNILDDAERVKFFKWLDSFEYQLMDIPKPDLTIVLSAPAEVVFELVQERAKKENIAYDFLEKDLEHLRRAVKIYQEIAQLFPNTRLVECMSEGELMAPADIQNKVWDLVRRIALKGITPLSIN